MPARLLPLRGTGTPPGRSLPHLPRPRRSLPHPPLPTVSGCLSPLPTGSRAAQPGTAFPPPLAIPRGRRRARPGPPAPPPAEPAGAQPGQFPAAARVGLAVRSVTRMPGIVKAPCPPPPRWVVGNDAVSRCPLCWEQCACSPASHRGAAGGLGARRGSGGCRSSGGVGRARPSPAGTGDSPLCHPRLCERHARAGARWRGSAAPCPSRGRSPRRKRGLNPTERHRGTLPAPGPCRGRSRRPAGEGTGRSPLTPCRCRGSRICRARGVEADRIPWEPGPAARPARPDTPCLPPLCPLSPRRHGLVAAGAVPGLGGHCPRPARWEREHKRCCWCSGSDGGRAGGCGAVCACARRCAELCACARVCVHRDTSQLPLPLHPARPGSSRRGFFFLPFSSREAEGRGQALAVKDGGAAGVTAAPAAAAAGVAALGQGGLCQHGAAVPGH